MSQNTPFVDLTEFQTLYDPTGQLTVVDVARQADAGAMQAARGARSPFTLSHPAQAVWLRFEVLADSTAPRSWQIEVGRAVLDHVQLFTRSANGHWQASARVGAAEPFSARPVEHRHFVFPVNLEQGRPVEFMLRVQYAGPSAINVRLWQPAELQTAEVDQTAVFSLYFGLACGMLIYVGLLSIVVRDRGYLLYAGNVAATVIGFAAHTGLGAQFVWGNWPWWNSHGLFIGYGLSAAFSVALTRQFLRTRERVPRIDAALRAIQAVIVLGIVLSVCVPANVPGLLFSAMAISVPPFLLALGVLAVRRHWPGAPYFLAAWAALHCSVLVLQGRHYGIVPDNAFTANSIAFGSALEMILLSLALADLINDARRKNAALYEQLEERVADRTQELRVAQAELVGTARRAGMVEVATNVLHNVGNTLNSVNVTAQLLASRVADSRLAGLSRAMELVDDNGQDMLAFLKDDPRGQALPRYLRELAGELERERDGLLKELAHLTTNVEHIKNVVAAQQAYVGSSLHSEIVSPGELVEGALRIAILDSAASPALVVTDIHGMPPVRLDKTRVLQILVNLLTNAMQAMAQVPAGARSLHISARKLDARLCFVVRDSGCGIAPENFANIFTHGFTTRPEGHGFGLHASAQAAREMGGTLSAHSEGVGQGATFTLELPVED